MTRWLLPAALALGLLLPVSTPAQAAKPRDVRAVIAALRDAGVTGVVRDARHESSAASYLTTSSGNWAVWVFKSPTKSTDEALSGKGWEIDLGDAKPGRLYWSRWVSDHTLDPILPRNTGSYHALSLYGDNVVLSYRLDTRRGAPHRTYSTMPGAWIIVDDALTGR